MELSLQFGHGMKELCYHLVESWGGGLVILSPRDLAEAQLEDFADNVLRIPGGRVVLDPQFYFPRSDHHRLTAHGYWPSAEEYETSAFFSGPAMITLLAKLTEVNHRLGCEAFILPGLMANEVDEYWLATLESVAFEAPQHTDAPLYSTVALSANVVLAMEGIQLILEQFESLPVDGVYVLLEHPKGEYLVQTPGWLANALELVAGLRLLGKRVLVGYCNQQMLCLSAASACMIATGTWMNVRAFSLDKFQTQDDEIKRRAVWYYAPTTLSEYKPMFLDMAHRAKILGLLEAPSGYGGGYADALFSGVQPSSTEFGDRKAFRHYLYCMRHQASASKQETFDGTLAYLRQQLDDAEMLIKQTDANGVLSQDRGFGPTIDAVRSALIALEQCRGGMLRRAWSSL